MIRSVAILIGVLILPLAPVPLGHAKQCPRDSAEVGPICVDKYEASIWESNDRATIIRIKRGRIRSAKVLAKTAKRRGDIVDDYGSAGCTDIGSAVRISMPYPFPL